MSSQAATVRVSPDRRPLSGIGLVALLAAIGLLTAVNVYTTHGAFPQEDDGWYFEHFLKEGHSGFLPTLPDRPLLSTVYAVMHWAGQGKPAWLSVVNAIPWVLLALETGWLWSLLTPARRGFAWIAAALVLAPVLVESQTMTISFTPATVVPPVFAFAGILLLLRSDSMVALATAVLCGAAGVLLSEYGLAALAAGAVLIAALGMGSSGAARRAKLFSSGAFLAVGIGAYAVFVTLARFGAVAHAKNPTNVLSRFDLAIPFNLVSHLWYSLLGRYGAVAGSVQFAWDSKSTLAAGGFGVLTALLLLPAAAAAGEETVLKRLPWTWMGLAGGLCIGLAPFVLSGRNALEGLANSRFLIPVLPLAVCLVLMAGLEAFHRRFHAVFALVLCFLCGYSSLALSIRLNKERKWAETASVRLRPFVSGTNGLTLVLVRGTARAWFHLTPRLTATWPDEESRRVAAVDYGDMAGVLGERTACRLPESIDLEYRGMERKGKLGQVLLIEDMRNSSIEPFCIPSGAR